MNAYVGRLAPSPTGALHLGNVRTFMIAYLRARSQGGKLIMRMEDLDHPRDKAGASEEAIADLRWLGFEWDEEYVQSQRKHLYREALLKLNAYPCICSRKDVEAAQSAPHEGEQLYYGGACRGKFKSWHEACAAIGNGRLPCWRFRVPNDSYVEFEDAFVGHYAQDVGAVLGDFPLARDESGAGYTLACIVDDLAMGITEVVRGDDLLGVTPAQILLSRALGKAPPDYCHVPLVVGCDGKRLAKRHGDTRISTFRAMGKKPNEIIGLLAMSCGWAEMSEQVSLATLVDRFNLSTIPHKPFMI